METNKYATVLVGKNCKEMECKLIDIISVPEYIVLTESSKWNAVDAEFKDEEFVTDKLLKLKILKRLVLEAESSMDLCDEDRVADINVSNILAFKHGYQIYLVFELPDGKKFVYNSTGKDDSYKYSLNMANIDINALNDVIDGYAEVTSFEDYNCVLKIQCDDYGFENRCKDEHIDAMVTAIIKHKIIHDTDNVVYFKPVYEEIAKRLGDYEFNDLFIESEDGYINIKYTKSPMKSSGEPSDMEILFGGPAYTFENNLPAELVNIDSLIQYFDEKVISFSIDYDDFNLTNLEIFESVSEIPELVIREFWT